MTSALNRSFCSKALELGADKKWVNIREIGIALFPNNGQMLGNIVKVADSCKSQGYGDISMGGSFLLTEEGIAFANS